MTTATEIAVPFDSPIFADDPSPFDITTIEVKQSPSAERELTPPNTVRVIFFSGASSDPAEGRWKLLRGTPASEQRRIKYSLYFETPDDKILQLADAAGTVSLTIPLVSPSPAPLSVYSARRLDTSMADESPAFRAEAIFTDTGAPLLVGDETEPVWTNAKNERRCELIDKEIARTLSATERAEVEELQAQMLAYRRQVAPLPLDELRRLHQDLLRRRRNDPD